MGEVPLIAAGDLFGGAAADRDGRQGGWIVIGEDPADGKSVVKEGGGGGDSRFGAVAAHDHRD